MAESINYKSWKKDYEKELAGFEGKQVFLLFSGGKDSSLALDLLNQARPEFGFKLEVLNGAYPAHRYIKPDEARIGAYWEKRGLNIVWRDLGRDDGILARSKDPCRLCQKRRKEELKREMAQRIKKWDQLVLAVCYSLWDIASYSVEHLLTGVFAPPLKPAEGHDRRFLEVAQRFYPLLTMKEGYAVFRPVIKYNGTDIEAYIRKRRIPILTTPCRFRDMRPKRNLEKYYKLASLRFDYGRVLAFAQQAFGLPPAAEFARLAKDKYLGEVF